VERSQDNGIWSWPRLNLLTMIQLIDLWERVHFILFMDRSLKGVVDLVKFPNLEDKRSVDASEFAESIQEMHEQVKRKLQQSNTRYISKEQICEEDKRFLKKESW
jgi:hypothetical protein